MGDGEGKGSFICDSSLELGIAYAEHDREGQKGGPTGYLAWKMMVSLLSILTVSWQCSFVFFI